jgi:anti-sigma factor RsiW
VTMSGAHPSHEALAALAADRNGAGELGSAGVDTGDLALGPEQLARVQEHVGRCDRCRDEVALLGEGAAALAMLGQPELPAGLHDRLISAVREEMTRDGAPALLPGGAAAGTAAAREQDRAGGEAAVVDMASASGRVPRRARYARRWLGWGTAAAAVIALAVAGVSGLSQLGGGSGEADGAGGGMAYDQGSEQPTAGAAAAGAVPRFPASGDYNLDRLRQDLATRPDLRAAYAASYQRRGERASALDSAEGGPPPSTTVTGRQDEQPRTPEVQPHSGSARGGGDANLKRACPQVSSKGAQEIVIDASYRGRPAMLVIWVQGDPAVVFLRAFTPDGCTLLGTEQGSAPPP